MPVQKHYNRVRYKMGEGIADAKIDHSRGSVICTSVDPAKYSIAAKSIFGPECYHMYDYSFYYANIAANVKQRIRTFSPTGR